MYNLNDTHALRAQIALPLLAEIGLRRAKDAVMYFGSAEEAMRASKADWLQVPGISETVVEQLLASRDDAWKRADQELAFIEKHQIQTYYFEDSDYPQRLAQCPDCPMLLYGKGELRVNQGKFVSVVGTRMPSDRGRQLCEDLVKDLATKIPDVTIVSGLAYGIDITAHKAALEAGIPTFVIPGHGLDRIYPSQHRQTAVQVLEKGGILTEYMGGTEPVASNFVARNRIIAGLSDAVVVVESKEKGGSLITADMAMGYNRDLFAFPGRPSDAQSAGCNKLIKQMRAALIESADDLIAAMGWQPAQGSEGYQLELDNLFLELAPEEQAVMNILHQNEDGVHVNHIVMELKMPYGPMSALLFQMQMRGLVRSLPGGVYRAAK